MEGGHRNAGDDGPKPPQRRAIGCLALLFMVGGVPLLAAGLLIYHQASQSAAGHPGTAGALSGLTLVVGLAVAALGVLAFILGAVLYVRSAPKE